MADTTALRYVRHRPLLPDHAWDRLIDTRITVAGVGGLGSNVCQLLARLAPLQLEIWDPASIDEPDLNRQTLYTPSDLGLQKVTVAERRLRDINPDLSIRTHARPISAEAFRAEDPKRTVIFDCLDSFAARGALETIRRRDAIAVIHGGVEGTHGQACLLPAYGQGYSAIFGSDFGNAPPAGKPVAAHAVAAIASLQIGLLWDWARQERAGEGPGALLIYDGDRLTVDRIELAGAERAR